MPVDFEMTFGQGQDAASVCKLRIVFAFLKFFFFFLRRIRNRDRYVAHKAYDIYYLIFIILYRKSL